MTTTPLPTPTEQPAPVPLSATLAWIRATLAHNAAGHLSAADVVQALNEHFDRSVAEHGELAALGRFQMRDLTTEYDDQHWFPFVEDEDSNITGPGHQDPAAFAALVNHYDAVASGFEELEGERWREDQIIHRWILVDPTREKFVVDGVTAATEGAIPVTTLWGAR